MSALPPEHASGAPDDADTARWEHAACGLLTTDGDGGILRANATLCRWLGVDASTLAGNRRLQDLLTIGGRIFHQTHWAPLLQMQGSLSEVKLDLVGPGGRPLPVVMNAIRRDTPNGPRHDVALFVATDRHAYERELLAARRRAETLAAEQRAAREALQVAETRLRLALDAGDLHVFEIDTATGVRTFDPSFARLLGRLAPGPVTLEEYRAAIPPEDVGAAQAAFDDMTADPSRPYRASYRLAGVDGVTRTVLATARALTGDDGAVVRVVGVVQDITELAARRAAAEDRALFAEQLVGIVSHDLRTPLSTIAMGSESLLLPGAAAMVPEVAPRIRRAAAKARRLADDLLDFTRARLGRGIEVSPAPLDLHRFVAELVGDLRAAHPRRDIRHDARGDGPAAADAMRLAQVIANLVANAVAYGAADAPVTVRSQAGTAGWSVAVHNHGPPIPAEAIARLFQPMVRGDARHGSSSVGLGLYIVERIVAAHGGRVRVASDAVGGTVFTARFPPPPAA